MIASLPMYDRPETRAAHDRLWNRIRDEFRTKGIDAPPELARGNDPWDDWHSPDLLMSQTCGFPYRAHLHGKVRLVGAPDHGLPDCAAGMYYSVFIARRDDARATVREFENAILAFNDPVSQSGWAAPWSHAQNQGLAFQWLLQTGAHIKSAQAVAQAKADIAAIDSISWQLIQRHDQFAEELRIIEKTDPTPALPYICAMGQHPADIATCLKNAISGLDASDKTALCLFDLVEAKAQDYLAVPTPPATQ